MPLETLFFTWAICCVQFSLWSMITPRYLKLLALWRLTPFTLITARLSSWSSSNPFRAPYTVSPINRMWSSYTGSSVTRNLLLFLWLLPLIIVIRPPLSGRGEGPLFQSCHTIQDNSYSQPNWPREHRKYQHDTTSGLLLFIWACNPSTNHRPETITHGGGGGVFCHNALLHGSHSMGHEELPYTTHAPIAIQGSRINMSDMNHEGQILHIGYGHHTGVTNNIRGHASICPTWIMKDKYYTLDTGTIQGSRTTYGVTHQSTLVTNILPY